MGAWSERLKELKKGKQRDEAAVAEAEAGVKGVSREAKELFAKAKEIEDAVYDLKAVNPNKNRPWIRGYRKNSLTSSRQKIARSLRCWQCFDHERCQVDEIRSKGMGRPLRFQE